MIARRRPSNRLYHREREREVDVIPFHRRYPSSALCLSSWFPLVRVSFATRHLCCRSICPALRRVGYIYIYNTWTRKRLLLLQFNHFCNCPESSALRRATGTASPASSAAIKQWLVQWCRPEVLDSWCPPNFISFAPIIHYELLPKMTATRLGISMANRSIITQPHKRLVKGGQKRKRKKTRRRKSRCRCGINGPWEALNSAATPARISNEKFRIFLAAVVYVFVKNGSN